MAECSGLGTVPSLILPLTPCGGSACLMSHDPGALVPEPFGSCFLPSPQRGLQTPPQRGFFPCLRTPKSSAQGRNSSWECWPASQFFPVSLSQSRPGSR